MYQENRILVVISSLADGGAQRVASNFVCSIPDNYEVDILLNDATDIVYPYKGNIIGLGMKKQADKNGLLYQARVFVRRLFRLKEMKNHGGYKAVYSFMDSANIANILTGNRCCKTIISIHSTLSSNAYNRNYRFIVIPLVKLLYKYASTIICVSKGIQEDLTGRIGYKGSNVTTIYNGFDIERIRELGKEPLDSTQENLLRGGPNLVTMGRLNRAKGYWHLIRAMKLVVEENPMTKLILLGEGEQRGYLERLILDLNLEKNVILAGFMSNPFKIISKADIFVLSSIFEGLPSVLIEALALGRPCISTDFESGAREILDDTLEVGEHVHDNIFEAKYGILTPVCDGTEYGFDNSITKEEHLLAEAIVSLINNVKLREKYSEISKEAVSRFTINTMTKQWLDLCE